MSRFILAQYGGLDLSGSDYTVVGVIAAIALAALAVGAVLMREVLAASPGTPRMQEIGLAIQEGASAYLNRQFKTLSGFAAIVFVLLFALPLAVWSDQRRPVGSDRPASTLGERAPREGAPAAPRTIAIAASHSAISPPAPSTLAGMLAR